MVGQCKVGICEFSGYTCPMRFIVYALISAALFGAATPLSKALLPSFSAFQLAGLLYLGAALGVSASAFRRSRRSQLLKMDFRNIFRLCGAILFGGVLAPMFLLLGLKAASAASVSLWLPLELVATAVFGRILFQDHLGKFGWLGMAGVVAAGILLSYGEGSAGIKSGLLVMLACACWGLDNNFTALIDAISPAQSTFWKGLFAGSINLSIGLSTQEFNGTAGAVAGALGVGILAYGASIVLYITAAQNIGAARGQIFFASGPFFGVVLSAIILGEMVSQLQLISAVLLVISLMLVFLDRHEHSHVHASLEHEHEHGHRHDDGHHDHVHAGPPKAVRHSHRHLHRPVSHSHPHWPDLHHRHSHGSK